MRHQLIFATTHGIESIVRDGYAWYLCSFVTLEKANEWLPFCHDIRLRKTRLFLKRAVVHRSNLIVFLYWSRLMNP